MGSLLLLFHYALHLGCFFTLCISINNPSLPLCYLFILRFVRHIRGLVRIYNFLWPSCLKSMEGLSQPFDEKKFNFNKIDQVYECYVNDSVDTKYNQWLHHDLRKCYMKVTILFSYYVFLFTGKRAHFQVEKEGWREVGY